MCLNTKLVSVPLFLVLILLGLAIYGQTFWFGFVFDDHQFIVNNPYIRSFDTIDGIWSSLPKTRMLGIYSFALNYWINQLNPAGYHIFNFIIHLIATGLVWALAGILFRLINQKESQLPFMVAVLFLVHPVQTQAVTYISQRFESMATVFYLSTMYCYLSARLSPAGARKMALFVFAGTCAILGIFTKEVAITVPLMILLAELLLLGPVEKTKQGFSYVGIIIGGVLLGFLLMRLLHTDFRVFYGSIASESHQGDMLSAGSYFLTQMRVFLTFLRLLIFPVLQNVDYDYPASVGLLQPPLTLLGVCAIAGILYLIIRLRRYLPLVSFGLAWVLVTFSINLVPRSNVIFEHKLYLISFGFILAFCAAMSFLIRHRFTLWMVFLVLTLLLSIASFQRNQVWRDGRTLWQDVVEKSPLKQRGYANLGLSYARLGQYNEAIVVLNKAIVINPNNSKNYINRAVSYDQLGNHPEALEDYNKAISMEPANVLLYKNRAHCYAVMQQWPEALKDIEMALRLNPKDAQMRLIYQDLKNHVLKS